jgi:hypothetical protein
VNTFIQHTQSLQKATLFLGIALSLVLVIGLGGCSKKNGATPGLDLNEAEAQDKKDKNGVDIGDADFLIHELNPNEGKKGDVIAIVGEDLNPDTDLILFGGKPVPPYNGILGKNEGETLSVQVPKGCGSVQVYVLRDPNNQKLKSNSLPFQYTDAPTCEASGSEGDKKSGSSSNGGTTSDTVVGDAENAEAEGSGFKPTSAGFQAQTYVDKNFIIKDYSKEGKTEENTATFHYQIDSGAYTHVDILMQGMGDDAFYKMASMEATANKQGSYSMNPYNAVKIKAQFYDDEELISESDAHEVKVFGSQNYAGLASDVKVTVEQEEVEANAQNLFKPIIKFSWATNNIQKLTFKYDKNTSLFGKYTYNVPADKILSGSKSFIPMVQKKEIKIEVIATYPNGDEQILIKTVKVKTAPSKQPGLKLSKKQVFMKSNPENPTSPHMVQINFEAKNLKWAMIDSPMPLYGDDYYEIKADIEGVDPKRYFYAVELDPFKEKQDFVYYSHSNCKSKNKEYCNYMLYAVGHDGAAYEETQSLFEYVPDVEKFQIALQNGDWKKMEISYKVLNAQKLEIRPCSSDNKNPVIVQNNNVLKQDDLNNLPFCGTGPATAYLTYSDFFGNVYSDFHYAQNNPGAASAQLEVIPLYGNEDMQGKTNEVLTKYEIKWNTNWAKSAKIVGTHAYNGTQCYEKTLNLSYNIVQEGSGDIAKFHAPSSETFFIYAKPQCHRFTIIGYNPYGHFIYSNEVDAPGRVAMKYWWSTTDQTVTTHHSNDEFHWGQFHYDDRYWCDPQSIQHKYYVEVTNAWLSEFEGGTEDGITYVCPENAISENTDDDKGSLMHARHVTFQYTHSHFNDEPGKVYGCRLVVKGLDERTYKSAFKKFPNEHPTNVFPECGGYYSYHESKGDSPKYHH